MYNIFSFIINDVVPIFYSLEEKIMKQTLQFDSILIVKNAFILFLIVSKIFHYLTFSSMLLSVNVFSRYELFNLTEK